MTSNDEASINKPGMKAHGAEDKSSGSSIGTATRFWQRVGLLRVGLATLVLLCLPMAFFTTTDPVGWQVIPSYVIPGLVVCIVWGLPFDILMSRIFLVGEYAEGYRQRHRSIVILDVGLVTALLIFWGPFFLSILRR